MLDNTHNAELHNLPPLPEYNKIYDSYKKGELWKRTMILEAIVFNKICLLSLQMQGIECEKTHFLFSTYSDRMWMGVLTN